MYKVFIAENVPSLNKGEMAILEGMLESLDALGEVEVSILSGLPSIDRHRYGTRVRVIDLGAYLPLSRDLGFRHICRWIVGLLFSLAFLFQHMCFLTLYKTFGPRVLRLTRSAIWKLYAECDLILVGHDNCFGIGGGVGTLVLFYPLLIPIVARVLRKPIALYGGTVQPPMRFRWLLGKAYKFALSKMDLITLRERISYQNLRAFGLQSDKAFVTADPAFLLKPASAERVRKLMEEEGIKRNANPLIGMTVTRAIASMAFPQLNSPRDSYHAHVHMLAEVVDSLTQRLCATVVFIPHCIGYGEKLDDRIVTQDVFQNCQTKERVTVIATEYSAAELKGLIGQLDLFIGERLHSVINAMSLGVPSIVISNAADQRLDIIRMLGQDNAICRVEDLDSQTLLTRTEATWSRREAISQALKSRVAIMKQRARLNGKLLKELLDSREMDQD